MSGVRAWLRDRGRWRRVAAWVLVVGATAGLALGLGAVGVPSPSLFAGLIVGLGYAVGWRVRLTVPRPVNLGAYSLTGAVTGQLMTADVLRSVGADWLPVLASLLGTLLLTVAGGFVLARLTVIDRTTAVFGMIAGGASGVIAISDASGADSRVVTVIQYLRVLIVLWTIPLVVFVVPAGHGGSEPDAAGGTAAGLLFLGATAVVGLVLSRLTRFSGGQVLGPLLVAAAVAIAAPGLVNPAPSILLDVVFAVIGLQVGLRFNREYLALIARAFWAITLMIFALLVSCGVLGAGVAAWTGRPLFDSYLATTPGGLYAVLAAAIETGADAPFVSSVQVFRLITMLLAAPLLAAFMRRHGSS